MPFEHDVFISYPHLSNQSDDSGSNGWVAEFHQKLKEKLLESLGPKVRIWRDNKMQVGAVFGKEILDRLAKSKVLLCVLSPAYLKSEWCMREVREFRRLAGESDLTAGTQSRIITVVKTDLGAPLPDEFKDSLCMEFYEKTEDAGGAPREFGQKPNGYKHEEYDRRFGLVWWSVKNLLEAMGGEEQDVGRTVFLAETTDDPALRDKRATIEKELEGRKLSVVKPDNLPRRNAQEYAEGVRRCLGRCSMSVHLMGKTYGTILDDAETVTFGGEGGQTQDKSIIYMQHELAAERHRQYEHFNHLVWIEPAVAVTNPRQAAFLSALLKDTDVQGGAEVLERNFQGFTSRISQIIKKTERRKPREDNLIRIYLQCERADLGIEHPEQAAVVDTVWEQLFKMGYEVIPPASDDGKVPALQYHNDGLLTCDATLILYGKSSRDWVQLRVNELGNERELGLGRKSKIPYNAILRIDPRSSQKDRYLTNVADLLPCCYNFPEGPEPLETALSKFIDGLEQKLLEGGVGDDRVGTAD